MKDKQKQFGRDWTDGTVTFPKHLTPKIIHSALFVFNAPKEEVAQRVQYCAKQIGDEAMSYAMALLVLPHLINKTTDTQEYKDFITSKKKTIN